MYYTNIFFLSKINDIIPYNMTLIIGLGNPGPKFQKTRHNIGFMALDAFSKENGFLDWKKSEKNNCLFTKKEIDNEEIELIKPLAFMNNSGRVAKSIIKKHNLKSENIIVVHDDIDLPLGKIKIVKNRGAAGHKGVQSIISELRTKDFIRIRIGIKNTKISNRKQKTEDFVLKKFNKEEEKNLKPVIEKSVEAIEFFLKEGLEKTMGEFNK